MLPGVMGVGGADLDGSLHGLRRALETHLFPVREVNRLAVALDFATALLHQNFVPIHLGIVMHHGRRIGSERCFRARHDHLRLRPLHIRRRRQIHRARRDRHRHVGLLLIVGRVLFDDDQRILFHRVVGAIVKHNFRHALGAGLHHVAFFQRHVVVGVDPAVAVAFSHPDRAIQHREVRLLRDRRGRRLERRRQSRNLF